MKVKAWRILLFILLSSLFVGCSKAERGLQETAYVKAEENNRQEKQPVSKLKIAEYIDSEEFTLPPNLKIAIEELALNYDTFDSSKTKERFYPKFFLSSYCQNSRMTYDYMEKIEKENNGLISRKEVEYIQYSLTKEFIDFQDFVGKEGIDHNQTSSGIGFGEIISYEANRNGDEVSLTAQFKFRGRNVEQTSLSRLYELNIVLIKNLKSCFDGYSIKSLIKKDITSVITGDGKIHTFQGLDMGIADEGIFTFECFGGEDGVIYGTHVEVDLSDNPTLADFVRKNTGKEFEVVYILEGTMTQPVEQVVPIGIKLY